MRAQIDLGIRFQVAREKGIVFDRDRVKRQILKQGVAKLALDGVPALAEALEIDPAVLLRAALEQQFSPETVALIRKIMSTTLTENEKEIIQHIRSIAGDNDPHLSDKLRKAITDALA